MIVVAVIGVCVSGCGGSSPSKSSAASAPNAETSSVTEASTSTHAGSWTTECTSRESSGEVEVTIYSTTGNQECEGFDRGQAKANESFWQVLSGLPIRSHPVCSMSKGGIIIEVRQPRNADTTTAERICARMTAQGWTETLGPGEEAEQREAEKEAKAKQEREARESHERAEADRKNEAEQAAGQRKLEAEQRKVEAEQKQQEQRNKKQLERDEQQNREDTHRAEEEANRAQREAESGGH